MSTPAYIDNLDGKGALGEIKSQHEDHVLMLECAGLAETFDEDELSAIANYLTAFRAGHKHKLFRQGDPSNVAWIIAYGVVELTTLDGTGRRVATTELDVGDVCGDLEFIDGEFRGSTAAVISDNAILLHLSRDSYDKLCHEHPEIGHKLMVRLAKDICARLRATSTNLTGLYRAK